MKVRIAGDTPMERLTNFTRKIVAVSKDDVASLDKKWKSKRRTKPRRK